MADYLKGQEKMNELYDGSALAAAVCSVLSQLPAGPMTLVATSAAGVAVAAACAATREAPTRWAMLDLRLSTDPIDGQLIVVDPVDGGEGWRDALLRRFPNAQFISLASMRRLDLAA